MITVIIIARSQGQGKEKVSMGKKQCSHRSKISHGFFEILLIHLAVAQTEETKCFSLSKDFSLCLFYLLCSFLSFTNLALTV